MMKVIYALIFLSEKMIHSVLKNIEKILKILMGGTKFEITVIKYIRTKKKPIKMHAKIFCG